MLEKVGCWEAALEVYRLALFPFVSWLSVHSQDVSNPLAQFPEPPPGAMSIMMESIHQSVKRKRSSLLLAASLRVLVAVKRTG